MNDQFDDQTSYNTPDPFFHEHKTTPPSDNGFAVAALVLGIISLIFTLLSCCGLFFISPILSIVAIIMACLSKGNSQAMPGTAKAGLTLAIISLCIIAIIVSLIFLAIINPFIWLL